MVAPQDYVPRFSMALKSKQIPHLLLFENGPENIHSPN